MEKTKDLPIQNEKISLFRRIYNKLFYRKAEESEISKIAEQLSIESQQEQKENSEKGFVPDKRTVVYDFFKNDILSNDGIRMWETKQTIQFTNSEGHERTFDISVDRHGIGEIESGESRIFAYINSYSTGDYSVHVVRNAVEEYIHLIKYAQFINSKTGDKTFINELGQEIEKASNGYDPNSIYEANKAGKRLDKALLKNPIYKQIKTSFDRAREEYKKTFNEFRQNEANRIDSFNKKNRFREELKVENIPEIEQAENVESREKEDKEIKD